MKNPNPIARARRIEMRRKQLGYPSRCLYCGETDLFCFEEDHPVTHELDEKFKRVVCRNCHRKLEASRDIKGLTKNGKHDVVESALEKERRYLLLMAEDEDSQAELLQCKPDTPVELIVAASQARAASLRRKAQALSLSDLPVAAQQSDGLDAA
jgi:hypothetical protein